MTRGKAAPAQKSVRISDLIIPAFWESFNDTSHAHKILSSGRAGTKSSETAIEAVYKIIQDEPQSVVVIRKRHNKLRKTVYNEAKRAIGRLGLSLKDFDITVSPMEITYKANGNTIYFTGSDSGDDTKGIIDKDGRRICACYVDEVSDFFLHGNDGESELRNIEATFVRGNPSGTFQMIYAFNPPKNPNAGVNVWAKKMAERPDVLRVHVTYQDVPVAWLGQALIDSAEALKLVDKKQYDWLWLGLPVGIDDLIYYMYNKERHETAPRLRHYDHIGIGVDYGQMNATTFQAAGLNEETHRLEGLAEYYHSGRDGSQKSPSDYGKDFAAFVAGLAIRYGCAYFTTYIDPSAKGLAEEIKRATRGMPFTVLTRDAENDVALGISRVQKLLTFDRLTISPLQRNAIREFGLYEYDEKSISRGSEKPLKIHDHCMDALRYLVMGMWPKVKAYLPKSVQEKDDQPKEEAA